MIFDESKKYAILVNNKQDYIDIQEYFFKLNIYWLHNITPNIYPSDKFLMSYLTFPRYINLFKTTFNDKLSLINNDEKTDIIILASTLLRKQKLKKLYD